ncbi:hypothetical protein Goklo_023832 [Gossypium klotzschianum]|uniref:Di19 C-terminal domain-containing protein n=1 Tax=Gossypium klotzschianum TaxID=34286 RepID=A0A7J8W492_9ROSI|nr:hypothetical protein [Gossypium klotzschianum]
MQRKRKSRKGGSHSTLSLLRKELREGNLQSFFGGSSCTVSSNSAPDPLLSSFILPMVDDFVSVQPNFSRETRTTKKSSDVNKSERQVLHIKLLVLKPYSNIQRKLMICIARYFLGELLHGNFLSVLPVDDVYAFISFLVLIIGFDDRNVKSSPLSVKDQEEKAKRCEFVQGLLLSTIRLMKFYKTAFSGSNRLLQCNREPESHGEIGLTMKSPPQANLQIHGSLLCL